MTRNMGIIWGILLSLANMAKADLVWHSAMDGDATALVGLDGVATGSPTGMTDKNGNPNGAVDFSGGNFFYEVDATPEITSLSAGSISLWARWNNSTGEQGLAAVGESGIGQTEYFTMMRQDATTVRTDVDDGDDGQGRVASTKFSLSTDTWYHLVAVFTAQVSVQLYVDGVSAGAAGLTTGETSLDALNTWLIGTERTSGRFLDGSLDDVRIYNHRLSDTEVDDLFAAGPLYAAIPEASSLSLILLGFVLLRKFRRT